MSKDIRPLTEDEEIEVLAGLSDRTKLIAAGWVFRVLADGLGGGRTYRRLLQDLGFPSDDLVDGEHAYRYLLNTAMSVNNALNRPGFPWRLQTVRGWSHDDRNQVSARSA